MYEAWESFIDIPFDELLAKLRVKNSWSLALFLSRLFLEHSKVPWRPVDKKRSVLQVLESNEYFE
jgi:hypothetical protein